MRASGVGKTLACERTMRVVRLVSVLAVAASLGCGTRDVSPPSPSSQCTPAGCAANACGTFPDNCGGTIDCGTCASEQPLAIGRGDFRDASQPIFGFPGGTVAASFDGPRLAVTLEHWPAAPEHRDVVAVVIDGVRGDLSLLEGRHTYVLAENLPAGTHTVRLTKRTEGLVGRVQFLGFDAERVVAGTARRRTLLFIGDSITAGYGVLGGVPECTFSASSEDFLSTYASLTAAALDAEPIAVAASGRGVLRNVDGGTGETMLHLFDRALPFDASSSWDHARTRPDAVVIALGTNDFATGVPDREAFTAAFAALTEKVTRAHPGVPLLIAHSPMLSDSYPAGQQQRSAATRYLAEVVASLRQSGVRVRFVDFAEQSDTGLGCDWHPGPSHHRQMADLLTAELKRELGW